MNEVPCRDEAVHAGTIIEAVRTPKRRNHIAERRCGKAASHPTPVWRMAQGAGPRENETASFWVRRTVQLGHLSCPEAGQPLACRHACRKELKVSNDRLHFRRVRRHGAPVHAALHTGVYALLDRDFSSCLGAVARITVEQAPKRQTEPLGAGVQMAIAAGEIISGVTLGWL